MWIRKEPLPSGNLLHSHWKWPSRKFVSFPIQNGGSFPAYWTLDQRVNLRFPMVFLWFFPFFLWVFLWFWALEAHGMWSIGGRYSLENHSKKHQESIENQHVEGVNQRSQWGIVNSYGTNYQYSYHQSENQQMIVDTAKRTFIESKHKRETCREAKWNYILNRCDDQVAHVVSQDCGFWSITGEA